MNKKKLIILIVVIVAILGAITFLNLDNNKNSGLLKVGVILPLSGQYGFLGESSKNAMILAKEELGADHIEIIFEDDKYEAKTGISAYRKLKDIDKVNAVIAISAPVLEALKPIVAEDNTLLFSLGESLFHENDTVFQLMPSGNDIFPKLGEITSEKYENIALTYNNASLWATNASMYKEEVGTNSKINEFKLNSGSDYKTEAKKVLETNPDAVTAFMPLEEALKFLKEIRILDKDKKVEVICEANMLYSISQYVEVLGSDMFEGCIMTSLPNTFTQKFIDSYKNRFDSDPIIASDYAYDSISIIEDLSKETGDVSKWSNLLKKKNYSHKGASGEIRFNEFGTRNPETQAYEFNGTQFVEIN